MDVLIDKFCTKCKENKPSGEFYLSKDKLSSYCKKCTKEQVKSTYPARREKHNKQCKLRYESDPTYYTAKNRLSNVGITHEEYRAMLERQNGLCAICNKSESEKGKSGKPKALAADHCHTTNKFRGLLCSKCNRGMGNFSDNPDLMRLAIAYLEQK